MFHTTKKMIIGAVGVALISLTATIAEQKPRRQAQDRPNIIFILVDDMGWSDLGCYGSEIHTPNIDSLAADGIRFTQFYNTAKCNTTRASLLTGLYHQQCDMTGPNVMKNSATLGEVLRPAGYRTLASGKHHGTENLIDRGFDHYYGLRDGCCNFWNPGVQRVGEPAPARKRYRHWCDDETTYHPYTPDDRNFYTTDAFTDKALEWLDDPDLNEKPFFLYLAYTAPHFPLQAWPADIARYEGVYDEGYLAIREARYERMIETGLIDPEKNPLPEWDGKDWNAHDDLERRKEIRRMEIYAAMLDRADQNIGRVLNKLRAQGKLDNTLIFFASDNGACPDGTIRAKDKSTRLEDFGTINSYETPEQSWATVQDTPLRKWKGHSHEGGIRTPLIVYWPAGIKNTGGFYREPGHMIDIMPTLIELTGAEYPEKANKQKVLPMQGISLLPAFEGQPLVRPNPIYWEYSEGFAIRDGDMKAVRLRRAVDKEWELYDFSNDENETTDLAPSMPGKLKAMKQQWQEWYDSVSSYETDK